jgi:hypothetical protein
MTVFDKLLLDIGNLYDTIDYIYNTGGFMNCVECGDEIIHKDNIIIFWRDVLHFKCLNKFRKEQTEL